MDGSVATARLFYNLAAAPFQVAGLAAPFLARALANAPGAGFWPGRLAADPPRLGPAGPGPRVWLHGASLGEVKVAGSILFHLSQMLEGASFVVTSGTPHGLAEAHRTLGESALSLPYPLDLIGPVKRFLDRIRPDLYVVMETELWPNVLATLMLRQTPVVIANARLSARSFRGYLAAKRLFMPIVRGLSGVLAISGADGERFAALGAKQERIAVMGNAKYDRLLGLASPEAAGAAARRLGFGPDSKVLVAGSIRSREMGYVARAFAKLRESRHDVRLAAAPRHLNRVPELLRELDSHGISHRLLSRGPSGPETPAVVVDELGVLFDIYSAARVAFVGGSLVELGGQNPYEPAAWSVPVLFGPNMDNFAAEADSLVAAGGGLMVRDPERLAAELSRLFSDTDLCDSMGRSAKEALGDAVGSGKRQAEAIAKIALGRTG